MADLDGKFCAADQKQNEDTPMTTIADPPSMSEVVMTGTSDGDGDGDDAIDDEKLKINKAIDPPVNHVSASNRDAETGNPMCSGDQHDDTDIVTAAEILMGLNNNLVQPNSQAEDDRPFPILYETGLRGVPYMTRWVSRDEVKMINAVSASKPEANSNRQQKERDPTWIRSIAEKVKRQGVTPVRRTAEQNTKGLLKSVFEVTARADDQLSNTVTTAHHHTNKQNKKQPGRKPKPKRKRSPSTSSLSSSHSIRPFYSLDERNFVNAPTEDRTIRRSDDGHFDLDFNASRRDHVVQKVDIYDGDNQRKEYVKMTDLHFQAFKKEMAEATRPSASKKRKVEVERAPARQRRKVNLIVRESDDDDADDGPPAAARSFSGRLRNGKEFSGAGGNAVKR